MICTCVWENGLDTGPFIYVVDPACPEHGSAPNLSEIQRGRSPAGGAAGSGSESGDAADHLDPQNEDESRSENENEDEEES